MKKEAGFYRIDEIENITSLKRRFIYQKIKEGTFPASIPILGKCTGWTKQSIIDWCNKVTKEGSYEKQNKK